MKIYSVSDPEFRPYGKVLTGFDTAALIAAMKTVPMPESGTAYEPSIPAWRKAASLMPCRESSLRRDAHPDRDCWGYNTKLNCLEYHRDSEVNAGETDFVLLLAKEDEIEDGRLDTAKVKSLPRPGRRGGRGLRHDAPLCALSDGEDRFPRRRRFAEGHEHGEACFRAAE